MTSRRTSLAPVAGLLAALAAAAPAGSQERPSSPEYREATESLVCQCGCNSTIATCAMDHCHSAEPIREEIWERVANGESVAAVLDVFRERYGLQVLAAPPASGFHLTAWVMPFIALVLGAFVITMVLRSWRGKAEAEANVPAPSLSDQERARIERELRDFSS